MLLLLVIAACKTGDVTFFDGFGAKDEAPGSDTLEESPLGPYLMGSTIHVYARPGAGMRGNGQLEIYSTDAAVLEVVEQTVEKEYVAAEIDVVGAGEARIELWKNDWNLGGTVVAAHEVASPRVRWAPGVLARRDEIADLATNSGLVVGGTATFQIAYEDDDGNPVYGAGLGVVLASEPAISALATTEYHGLDGDWITLTAHVGPSGSVEFRRGQVNAGTYLFTIVDGPSAGSLALYTPEEEGALPGETVFAAALALGPEKARYYGVPGTWEVDGEATGDAGEIFPYTYDPGAPMRSLAISVGALVDEREVKIGDGDANVRGCATSPRRSGLVFAALMALLSRRRARPRRSDPLPR
jgi:hypothetical protein